MESLGIEVQYTPQDNPNILKELTSIKKIEEQFMDLLNDILQKSNEKIIIFIDELDRCNPIFAVKLLENFKHFFNDEKFIFVFSTNIMELKNTISNFYGYNFNSSYYLQKFFDIQFELPKVNLDMYVRNQLKLDFYGWQESVINEVMNIFRFSLRDCNRFFSMYKLALNYINMPNGFENNESQQIIKYVIFPILLGLKTKKFDVYNNIINGNGKEDFSKIILSGDGFIRVIKSVLEHMSDININIEKLINDLYDNLFIKQRIGNSTKIANGNIEITQFNVNTLYEMLSLINSIIALE